jgi:polyphosphate glucokinase
LAKKDDKSTKNAPLIGIDIGGTGIKGGIVDLKKGKLVGDRFRVPTPQPATPESVAETVAAVVEELNARPDAPAFDSPIGVTFPGIIQHGVVHSAANVDKSWLNTDIDTLLTKRLGRPVEVINDADAAGLAEARYGAGEGVSGTVLVITLGTGIGSAFIYDGMLIPNTELGHLNYKGESIERYAAYSAMEREELTWEKWAKRLQKFYTHVDFLFSPDLFVVGGGVSKHPDRFLPLLDVKTPIVPAVHRNSSGIIGAAALAGD